MKVKLGNYPSRWVCKLHKNYMNKAYGDMWEFDHIKWTKLDIFIEKLDDITQWVYNHTINLFLDRKKRKVVVKIHPYDAWNGFHTMSLIILPILKEVRAQKQGSPWVDDTDVPDNLGIRSTDITREENDWGWGNNVFKRWDFVLNEIIWAFEQIVDETSDDKFFNHHETEYDINNINNWKGCGFDKEGYDKWQARKQNGLRLFGKYLESIWT